MPELHMLANYLMEHEKIEGPDFEKLMRGEPTSVQEEEAKKASAETEEAKESEPESGTEE